MSLHERLEAEIERREYVAGRISAPAWSIKILHRRLDGTAQAEVRDGAGDALAEVGLIQDAECIALHDPADALRRYVHYRRILERHRESPTVIATPIGVLTVCVSCSDLDQETFRVVGWPCWEIRDLAEALGIEVDQ